MFSTRHYIEKKHQLSTRKSSKSRRAFQFCTEATSCVKVWKTSNVWPLRIGKVKERKNDEETIGRKYNDLPYWAAIIKVHNRIQLLELSGIILSAYIIASRWPTRFINTDSDSVVHQPNAINYLAYTAAFRVYVYLTISGFPYSAFPEYSCLAFSASPLHSCES